ncbi:MAG: helix-turn-helix domain-containing protein [Caldilineaceae bacterium]|nr:helix-turn-helix domain-containing protein [Caldilineaceae bacterium]
MLQAAEIKLAEQRLSMLELAKALGNVSAACKQRGMSRTQFYEYKRQYLWSQSTDSLGAHVAVAVELDALPET